MHVPFWTLAGNTLLTQIPLVSLEAEKMLSQTFLRTRGGREKLDAKQNKHDELFYIWQEMPFRLSDPWQVRCF